jgi:hypothetical protein
MSTSPEAAGDVMSLECAQLLARRMLAGGAACSVVAWRLDSQYDFVAHGLTENGALVVALRPDGDCPLSAMPAGHGVMVRLDLIRHSHEVMLSAIAASVHLLGELVLLPGVDVASLLAEGQLPERVAELAQVPGTRVGVVEADRLLIHDHGGVTPLSWDEVMAAPPNPLQDDFAAHAVVAELGIDALRQVCRAVSGGVLPGRATIRPNTVGICNHLLGQVFCIDVNPAGVTLMHINEQETATVFAGFEDRPASLPALSAELERLVSGSGPVRP